LELGVSLVLSDSLLGAFSDFASDFFVLLLVESAFFVESASLFFSLLVEELVELSDAGLLVVEGFVGDEAGTIGVGFGVVMAAAVPLGAAETAGAAVGAAVALVDALVLVEVLALVFVVPLVVVPLVLVTPTVKLGVTPKYP
jgi:hypothetical protein